MDLTEGSETSAKLNLTPGKYPKENIQKTNEHYLLADLTIVQAYHSSHQSLCVCVCGFFVYIIIYKYVYVNMQTVTGFM
jgi:hypothetical protein